MDGQLVSHDDKELAGLLEKFVLVRLVQMGGVDLATFQFDPLLSWSLFFMNADKTIYGRYGSAHPQAKRSKADSNPSHTMKGLKAALAGAVQSFADQLGTRGKLVIYAYDGSAEPHVVFPSAAPPP